MLSAVEFFEAIYDQLPDGGSIELKIARQTTDLALSHDGTESTPAHEHASTHELPDTVTLAQLLERKTEPPSFLVEPFVPMSGLTLIVGDGGVGKSFMLIDLAYCVATGTPFLGKFECAQGPVLTLDQENHGALIAARARKILAGRNGSAIDVEGLDITYMDREGPQGGMLRVDTESGKDWLTETTERIRPKLLIVDPLVTILARDESDNVMIMPPKYCAARATSATSSTPISSSAASRATLSSSNPTSCAR